MGEGQYPVLGIDRLRIGTDGEGVRTLIVFQQCPLRCRYCINPSAWNGAGKAVMMSAEEIYRRVLTDRPYFLATVTFGGGEPLLHSRGIREFADLNEDKFTIFIETSLNVPGENLEHSMGAVDRYYIDLKSIMNIQGGAAACPGQSGVFNGQSGKRADRGEIPVIPGFADEVEQESSRERLKQMGILKFDLFSYRRIP